MALALAVYGCAATPLSQFDAGGRDAATVEGDKLSCWQEAEAAHRATWREVGPGMAGALLFGIPGALAVDAIDDKSRDLRSERGRRINEMAEQCMVRRGYFAK